MNDIDSIINLKDYGEVRLKLKEYLDERKITRYSVKQKTGLRYDVIDKWYKNQIVRLDLDVLAKICFVLNCEAGDIIQYCK